MTPTASVLVAGVEEGLTGKLYATVFSSSFPFPISIAGSLACLLVRSLARLFARSLLLYDIVED